MSLAAGTFLGLLAILSPAVTAIGMPRGGALVVSLNSDIRGTNPGVNRDANTDAVMHHMVESLVGFDENLEIKPVVAESWELLDDARTYVFRLREGIHFHNGEPVTSAEVKWSLERYLDPATHWQCRSWYVAGDAAKAEDGAPSVIQFVEAPDPRTVVVGLSRPSTLFLSRLANIQCVPAILHPDSVGSDGKWRTPVGTGPYRLGTWRRGEYIELERFEDYRPRDGKADGLTGAKLALAKRVRFLVSPDTAATKAALLSGQIDVFPNFPMSGVEDLRASDSARVLVETTLEWTVLLMQTRDPLLSDVRIRRAIAHAIDRETLAKFNTRGYASINASAVPAGLPAHTPPHDRWHEHDVGKARALLAEAGYRGQPIRIQANRRYEDMYANAVVIQAMMHAAGMNAHIEVLDWAAQLANYYSGRFQLSTFGFSALAVPALRYYKLIGNKDLHAVKQWESERAAQVLDTAIGSFDVDRHQQLLEGLHLMMVEDIPIIGLYNSHSATVVRQAVQGFNPWAMNLPRLWGVWSEEWPE